NMAILLSDQGQHAQAIAHFRQALQIQPEHFACHNNMLLTMLYDQASEPATVLREHLAWNDRHAAPLAGEIPLHENYRDPDRPIRIGYVSPDLRDHPIGRMMLAILENHDSGEVEVTCYASVRNTDEVTA